MNCAEAEVLLHALIDGELDAGHAREVEAHVATCAACAEKLASFRALRVAMSGAALREPAPARSAQPHRTIADATEANIRSGDQRRSVAEWRSTDPALVLRRIRARRGPVRGGCRKPRPRIVPNNQGQEIDDDLLSAHLRSLQANHLLDVETSDQHTVKPWFNGRIDVAPPVIDLTAEGFTLLGGRLDYLAGEPVAAVVYQRRKHIINLFIARHSTAKAVGAASGSIRAITSVTGHKTGWTCGR